MNEWLNLPDGGWWYVAGWTMLHFLWLGTLVGLAAGVCRLVMRRASASFRYVTALACFALLAALPFGIAAMLVENFHRSSHVFQQVGVDEATGRPILHRVAATPPWLRKPATPGSAGGLTGALSEERPASVPPIVSHERATITNPNANPRQSRGLTDVVALVASYLPWAWLLGTPLTFLLLATGVAGAERLRRTSRVIDDGPIADACARIVESLRIGRRVTVAVCERIASPVLVGIVRPIILLPPAALTGWSPDEIEMVLLHELAHVRRWDNLVNLMQRFVESLLFFHPAVWLVSSWVRSEREACCDAVVVGRTNQPHAYAEMLVALAAQIPRSVLFHPAASSAMAAGPLRGRIRRILGLQDDPMLISGKSLGVVMGGLLLVVTLVTLNLPLRGQAKEPTGGDRVDDVAEALDAFRKAVVGYDLDFDSVFPQRGWTPYDAKRLERYPTSDAWPDVLGHVDSDAGKFRKVSGNLAEKNETVHETVTGGNAYLVPVDWSIGTKDYATLLLMRGLAADAHIVAHSYTSFASFGTLAGDVLFKSYATALVDGDMSGQITADSYFNLVVTGKFTGRIFTGSYAMIYLMGGFDGDMELENSKVFIAGRTPSAALKRIQGAGHVFLEESDLAAGEIKIGKLLVTVGKSVQPPAEVQMRQQIAQVEATNQLRYLALALHVYHDAKGAFPAAASYDVQGRPLLSWRVHILPYLDGSAAGGGTTAELYKEFHLDEPWDSEHNRKLIPRMPAVFRNPTGDVGAETRLTNHLAAVGPDCVFDGSAKGIKLSQIPDGTSNTVMVVEADEAVEWTKPDDFDFNPAMPKAGLGAQRPNCWLAAFADGSINRIKKDEPDEKVRDMFTSGRTTDPLELPTSDTASTSSRPLSEAVEEFNVRAQADDVGRHQLVLTEEEVLSAIANFDWDAAKVEPSVREIFKKISETHTLPHDAELDFMTRIVTGSESVNGWWIGLSVMTGPNKGYTLRVRESRADFVEFTPQSSVGSGATPTLFENRKLTVVPFVVGATRFADGDSITIVEVRGTSDNFEPGNAYQIVGKYTLGSRDRARLSAFTTAKNAAEGTGPIQTEQTTTVERGSGTFTLTLPMTVRGWPHVSFYPADGGEGFGGVYFGTGDSVLKKWWDSKEDVSPAARKLPSLEEQKLADLAWKRLGVELEPIRADELRRVNALGYEGGVSVSGTNRPGGQKYDSNRINSGDILVGLHVWPTKSLQDVATALNRDDLTELSPLKYYVVRRDPAENDRDLIFTGRISAPPSVLPELRPSMAPQLQQPYDIFAPATPQPAQSLQVPTIPNAVEPANRIPATQPTMLQIEVDPREIALDPNLQGPRPYRWLPPLTLAAPAPDPLTESEKQQLKAAGGVRIEFFYHPQADPSIKAAKLIPKYEQEFAGLVKVERINVAENPAAAKAADVDRVPTYKLYLGERSVMDRTGEMTIEQLDSTLASIARHEAMEPTVSMVKQPELRYDGKTFDTWWKRWWDNKDGAQERLDSLTAFGAFAAAGYGNDAMSMILEASFADHEVTAKIARRYLHDLSPEARAAVVHKLVQELQSDLSLKRRLAAMRALAAIGPPAEPALDVLKKALTAKDRNEQLVAAMAIKMIVGKDQYQKPLADLLGEELGIKAVQTHSGEWGVVPRQDVKQDDDRFSKFNDAVIEIQDDLFLSND